MMDIKYGDNVQLKIAKTISAIFHPLFTPLYGLIIILSSNTLFWYLPVKVKEILFFILLINNVLIPVTMIPLFRYRILTKSGDNNRNRDRMIPLLAVSILYSVTSFIFFRLHIPGFIKVYSFSLTILVIALLLINIRWNVSLYSAGAGSLIALVLVLSLKMSSGIPVILVLSVLVSGLILSSRLRLNKHNPAEIYAGLLSGFVLTGLFMLLFQ